MIYMPDATEHSDQEGGQTFEREQIEARDDWARRRRKGIPTDKQLRSWTH